MTLTSFFSSFSMNLKFDLISVQETGKESERDSVSDWNGKILAESQVMAQHQGYSRQTG